MRKRLLVPFALAGLLPLAATVPASAAAEPSGPVAVATHLNNPRQMTFGPDGTLYVAEAGSGAVNATVTGGCFPDPEGGTACAGNTSSITAVRNPGTAAAGSGRRVVNGLLSIAGTDGNFAVGLDALDYAPDGTRYGIVTAAPPDALPRPLARQSGEVLSIGAGGRIVRVADIAAYGLAHPNPGHEADSDPYSIVAAGRSVFVVDAANNTLLRVRDGRISTLHVFPYRHGGDGFDTVPTSVAVGPDHLLYVGTLASFIPGAAKVYVIDPDSGSVVRTIDGLTQVSSVAVGYNGTVYAAELFAGCAPDDHSCTPGRLVTIPQRGAREERKVPFPGGVAVQQGHLYVSVFAVFAGGGEVWRLR